MWIPRWVIRRREREEAAVLAELHRLDLQSAVPLAEATGINPKDGTEGYMAERDLHELIEGASNDLIVVDGETRASGMRWRPPNHRPAAVIDACREFNDTFRREAVALFRYLAEGRALARRERQ